MDHNRQRKAAVINDFASFGRCSLAVTIPILSAMKVQCCAVPTAIFTNHTGYPSFAWTDYTPHMNDYIREWLKLGLSFSAIQTGFLGSTAQIDFVFHFLDAFKHGDGGTIVAIDPVMGDYGRLYSTYSRELAEGMRRLVDIADILTPNLTEGCVLAGENYDPGMSEEKIWAICEKLSRPNNAKVVVTGVERDGELVNYALDPSCGGRRFTHVEKKIGEDRSGTGDVFSAVVLGGVINGETFEASVAKAAHFVARAVERSEELGLPSCDGLAIEEVLGDLIV